MNTVQTPPDFPRPRRYPRLELRAFVELGGGDDASAPLPVRNISRGGVLVAADAPLAARFPLGAMLPLVIVDAAGDIDAAARVEARVVRHDAGGMALSWDDSDASVTTVGAFLDRFYAKR